MYGRIFLLKNSHRKKGFQRSPMLKVFTADVTKFVIAVNYEYEKQSGSNTEQLLQTTLYSQCFASAYGALLVSHSLALCFARTFIIYIHRSKSSLNICWAARYIFLYFTCYRSSCHFWRNVLAVTSPWKFFCHAIRCHSFHTFKKTMFYYVGE